MEDNKVNSRRKFIKSSGAIAGITVIPSKSVWGACNASGVSGGSQALEDVCRVSGSESPDNISTGGFTANSFNTLFTSINSGNKLPSGKARKMAGDMFSKASWLDETSSAGSFVFPVFRCGNSFKTLIWDNGSIRDNNLKKEIQKIDSSVEDNASNVSIRSLKSVLNPRYDWHMNELHAVINKLKKIADVNIEYVSGVQSNGKASTASFNVLDMLEQLPAEPVKINIAALYLNLAAGFAGNIPIGYDAKSYCEHLVSIMLENATYPGFASDLMAKVSQTFSRPQSISASTLLS
ncbi:hypothetical protein [Alteromonas sp. P256]|uniref:hypothetical protein n=1 Tax=Alteromonas sp. P256 TaxID=3117399 RepID=UPI002FE4140F